MDRKWEFVFMNSSRNKLRREILLLQFDFNDLVHILNLNIISILSIDLVLNFETSSFTRSESRNLFGIRPEVELRLAIRFESAPYSKKGNCQFVLEMTHILVLKFTNGLQGVFSSFTTTKLNKFST